jgi:hypothetical protein
MNMNQEQKVRKVRKKVRNSPGEKVRKVRKSEKPNAKKVRKSVRI